MSYQPVMRMPPLRVMMVGAVGKIHLTPSNGIRPATSAQPWPVSPRPWRKMQTALVSPPSGGGTTIGLGYEGDEVAMAQCAREARTVRTAPQPSAAERRRV